jgi:hypothetical protein
METTGRRSTPDRGRGCFFLQREAGPKLLGTHGHTFGPPFSPIRFSSMGPNSDFLAGNFFDLCDSRWPFQPNARLFHIVESNFEWTMLSWRLWRL